MEADAKNAAASIDMEAAKRRGSRVMSMSSRSPNGPSRTRSPLSSAPLADVHEDTRTLLGGSRQPSPSPSMMNQGQRSLTGGSGYSPSGSNPSSPSRSEEGAYTEARR